MLLNRLRETNGIVNSEIASRQSIGSSREQLIEHEQNADYGHCGRNHGKPHGQSTVGEVCNNHFKGELMFHTYRQLFWKKFNSVAVTTTGFTEIAKAVAKAEGMADLRIAEYPGAVGVHQDDLVRKNVEDVLFGRICRRIDPAGERSNPAVIHRLPLWQ